MDKEKISIKDIMNILSKRKIPIILITLIITGISVYLNYFVIKPVYQASTEIFIGKGEESDKYYNSFDVAIYQKFLTSYSEVLQTEDLMEDALEDENIKMTPKEALEGLKVDSKKDSQVIEMTYISTDRYLAKEILDGLTNSFQKKVDDLTPYVKIGIVENAKLPSSPVKPNKIVNIAASFMLSLILSIGLAFLLEILNKSSEKENIEKATGIPVLGIIPLQINSKERNRKDASSRKRTTINEV